MIIHTYTATDIINYISGTKVAQDIARNGYITEILLKLTCTYNTATSVSAKEDGLANLLQAITISTAGRTYYNVQDGRQALFLAKCQYQDNIRNDALSTTASQTGVVGYMGIPIHLGLRFYNPADKTIVIPAERLPSLSLEITWGTNASLGTGYTISSANVSYTITEILKQTGETEASIFPGGILIPRMNAVSKSVTSAYANLSLTQDVPVGDLLTWILILVHGNTSGARCNNLVTEFGIVFPKEASVPYRVNFQAETIQSRRRWALSKDYKGVVFFPLSLISGNELGYNLSGYQVGDCQVAYTTSLTDTTEDSAQSGGGTIYQLFYNVGM